MAEGRDLTRREALNEAAIESGLAVVVVDKRSAQISRSNDNSICQALNPHRDFSPECAEYCGKAFDRVEDSQAPVTYRCHAGLECRAVPFHAGGKRLVAICGRAFTSVEDYHKATARAIEGDWSRFSPADLFENLLFASSADALESIVKKVESVAEATPLSGEKPAVLPAIPEVDETKQVESGSTQEDVGDIPSQATPNVPADASMKPIVSLPQPADDRLRRIAETRAWRSFFGSLLDVDYPKAAELILEFISRQFKFNSLIWLERRDQKLENLVAHGDMKGRKVRLGIAADDPRFSQALADERPLILGERSRGQKGRKTMHLFLFGLKDRVEAAIAVLDPIPDESTKQQVARFCRSITPQIEILRLRSAVDRAEQISSAVRMFSEQLKRPQTEDLWLNLTRNAAEILGSERTSLLVFDEETGEFEIKAMIGGKQPVSPTQKVGRRVARYVFDRKYPVAVADVTRTNLPAVPVERSYKTPSFLSCPISISGRMVGVINFADRADGRPFDRTSLELLQAIAPQLAVAIDRASLKEMAGEFEQLSVTDSLTGLLNRRYMEERLQEETKRSNRHGYPMSFMMLDVDEFKSYNDRFGHPAGDEALKLVGQVIRETLRGADVAARFGGEEFSILLPQTTGEEAVAIAERIRHNIEKTKFPHRPVTMSIGVSSCSAEGCLSADLVSTADKALYQAKRTGRNRVLAYDEVKGIHPPQPLHRK